MNCEQFLTHKETCPDCGNLSDSFERVWTDLGRVRVEPPPASLRDRVLVEAERAMVAPQSRPSWMRTALQAAIAAALLVAGGLLGPVVGDRVHHMFAAAPQPAGEEFLIMLYEAPEDMRPASAEGERESIAEHKAWARKLAESGTLVGGEKLDPSVRTVAAPNAGAAPVGAVLGGFFRIRAASFEEAVAIAQTCPHYLHGGVLEVRRIEPV
jgi:hypothetical protein